MMESPPTLQEIILQRIADDVDLHVRRHQFRLASLESTYAIPNSSASTSSSSTSIPDNEAFGGFLHSTLADRLLTLLSQQRRITDDTLKLFNSKSCQLRNVSIIGTHNSDGHFGGHDYPSPTLQGFRMLKQHKIKRLTATGITTVTVNDLIGCMCAWSLENIEHLGVSGSAFTTPSSKIPVVVALSKLRSLCSLDVSRTSFNQLGLEIVANDLPLIAHLNISDTKVNDVTPLRNMHKTLVSLGASKLRLPGAMSSAGIGVLKSLKLLRALDISGDQQYQIIAHPNSTFDVRELITTRRSLWPDLEYLDISSNTGIGERRLREFILLHPKLKEISLLLTGACKYSFLSNTSYENYQPDLVICGESNKSQILASVRRYANDSRPVFIQQSLYNLFVVSSEPSPHQDDLLNLIIKAMTNHSMEYGVQMAATACLYNLTRAELCSNVHVHTLSRMVNCTLQSMFNFATHQQLQKNCLLTLCSDRILQDVSFDRYRCASLVMDCLCRFEEPSMNRMSVAICGILAAKISTENTTKLGSKKIYMYKLLEIVKLKCDADTIDVTLKFTLSTLWNLTDESPVTCEMFMNEGGLDIFICMLYKYRNADPEDRMQVETKILGLINNLAEVSSIRPKLLTTNTLTVVRDLLKSREIDVSYFAAGIVANLLAKCNVFESNGAVIWTIEDFAAKDLLMDLKDAVFRWISPKCEMVAYRSMHPFLPLLDISVNQEVQLWALWAIRHVCSRNAERYCKMFVEQGGSVLVSSLTRDPNATPDIICMSAEIMDIVKCHLQR